MAGLVATVTSGPKVVELAHAVRRICDIVHSTLATFVDGGVGITVEITGQYITHYELSARGFGRSSKAILDAVEENVAGAARQMGCRHSISIGGDAVSQEIVIDVWCNNNSTGTNVCMASAHSRQGTFCVFASAVCYLTYATFVYYEFYSHVVRSALDYILHCF